LLPRSLAHWGQAALLAALYFGAAKLSLAFAIPPGYATPVWPSAGLALAAVLLFGGRLWPGIWLGAALVNLTVEASAFAAATIATGNTLEALVAGALVRRYIGVPRRFERGEDVVKFVFIAQAAALIAATVALLPVAYGHALSPEAMFWNWWTWWQGDAAGLIIVAPLILAWTGAGEMRWTRETRLEALLLLALLFATTTFAFGAPHGSLSFKFLMLPFIVWAAFRFSQREVTTVVAFSCGIALWYTLENGARLGVTGTNESLLLLLAFNSVVALLGLVLSAVLRERAQGLAELLRRHDELEVRVRERTRELEAANRAKSAFVATMSHELRTPLNSLLILAGLLRDNADRNLSPRQVQYATTIHSAGSDLLALINEMLDLARIESGAMAPPELSPVALAEVAARLENGFVQLAREKALDFRVTLQDAPAEMRTDARRLQQILRNLLANAFKFTHRGSVSLSIAQVAEGWPRGCARLDAAAGVVAFTVTDSGIGIPVDKHELVFHAFQQAEDSTSEQYGGTGLGLSISRELARLLGGEIVVMSEPGRGSRFTLYLPLGPERRA
jgi:signal transduction histidine kinase